MHIWGQKEAIWNTLFSIFERRQGPPNVAGPGTFLPHPSRRAWVQSIWSRSTIQNGTVMCQVGLASPSRLLQLDDDVIRRPRGWPSWPGDRVRRCGMNHGCRWCCETNSVVLTGDVETATLLTHLYNLPHHFITSKIKHAIKRKTSPARLALMLQPSLAFCFSLQPMTAHLHVLLHVLFYFYFYFTFTWNRSLIHSPQTTSEHHHHHHHHHHHPHQK